MNTDLKKAIIGLIHNLSVKSYNRTRVNDAIDKIVESSGGSGSDDDVAVFSINILNDKIDLKLLQGKPKYEGEYDSLKALFINTYEEYIVEIYRDYFNITCYTPYYVNNGLTTNRIIMYSGDNNISFEDLNVGDTAELTVSTTDTIFNFIEGIIQFNNSISFKPSMSKIPTTMFTKCFFYKNKQVENNVYANFVGKLIKFNEHDDINNLEYCYIEVDNEILKYSYNYVDNKKYITNITFVEVVQP